MKKSLEKLLIPFEKTLIIILVLLELLVLIQLYLVIKEHKEFENSLDLSIEEQSYKMVIQEEGATAIQDYEVEQYIEEVVPKHIEKFLRRKGWKIIISDEPLHERFGYDFLINGVTHGQKHGELAKPVGIYLDDREGVIDKALLHEIGHAVDCSCKFPSETTEFRVIFEKESNEYLKHISSFRYEISNEKEYFASVFRDIVLYGELVEQYIPETYKAVYVYTTEEGLEEY